MSYIGQGLPADTFQGFTTDKFTGDGTANKAFTLTKEPFSEDTILVTIDGVVQEPTDDFTVSGTTLPLVGTAANNAEVTVTHMGGPLPIGGAAELDLNGASDKLILDADGDTTISADTDDQIDIKVGGTDVVKITAATLDVTGPGNTGGIININNTDTEGANTDNIGRINFVGNDGSSSASGTRAAIETEVTGNFGSTQLNIEVAAGGAAAAKIATFSPTGLNLADGDLSVASGHGISFASAAGGTYADASGMASELLDDYEEGTWTGTFRSSAGHFSMNSSYQTGNYTRVGNIVTVTAYLIGSSEGLTDSDSVLVDGLPYTAVSGNVGYQAITVGYLDSASITAGHAASGYVNSNTNQIQLTMFDVATGISSMTVGELTGNGQLIFTATYRVA